MLHHLNHALFKDQNTPNTKPKVPLQLSTHSPISYNSKGRSFKEIDDYKTFDTKDLDGSKVCNAKELDNYLLANTLL